MALAPRRTTGGSAGVRGGVPEATVARLPIYHQSLGALIDRSVAVVSSEDLAAASGVTSAKLRKDLSHLGSYGTRGVGYDVLHLHAQISRRLGMTSDWPVVIVGVGNLGQALAGYGGFGSRGFRVAALLDTDSGRIGEQVGDPAITVRSVCELENVIAATGAQIGVIATPAASAQQICDRLVDSGITSILNFAPTVLSVPETVEVRTVDLASELSILAFHEQRKSVAGAERGTA